MFKTLRLGLYVILSLSVELVFANLGVWAAQIMSWLCAMDVKRRPNPLQTIAGVYSHED
jgi:hypothetical protein